MDPAWNSQPPKGTLPCILCKSVIAFPNKDKNKYFKHMQKDHGAFYNINLILIINLLERKQVLKLIANIKSGEINEALEKKDVCDAEVQTDYYYQAQPLEYSITDDDIVLIDEGAPVPRPMVFPNSGNNFVAQLDQIEELRKFVSQLNDDNQDELMNTIEPDNISTDVEIESAENLVDSNSFEMSVPSDLELEEAIPMSTPKINKKMKREPQKSNKSVDPVEVLIDDVEDFNILDVTNDDFVLTPGGPQPIKDYSSFVPGAVIPLSYDPAQLISQPFSIDSDHSSINDITVDGPLSKTNITEKEEVSKVEANVQYYSEKKSKKDKDMITTFLHNCSEYFKKYPNQVKTVSKDRALTFTEIEPSLPINWKCKSSMRHSGENMGRKDKEFLSPEMKVFRSRIAVVEYMKAMGGYSEAEMFKVLPVKVKKEKN